MELKECLRILRQIAGLTGEGLAERAGVDQGYVSKLESGKVREPHRANLEKLAMALGVSIQILRCEEPIPGWDRREAYVAALREHAQRESDDVVRRLIEANASAIETDDQMWILQLRCERESSGEQARP